MSSKCFVTADDYKRYWPKPEAVIVEMADHHGWPPEEMIAIFSSLLIHGWLEGEEMSPEIAARWGQKLGHWGLVALADQEVKREGWSVIKNAFEVADE